MNDGCRARDYNLTVAHNRTNYYVRWQTNLSQRRTDKRRRIKHFGFDDLTAGCGSCDVCTDQTAWLDQHMTESMPLTKGRSQEAKPEPEEAVARGDFGAGVAEEARAPAAADGEKDPTFGLSRGDWIDIAGIGLCCIVRVHRHGKTGRVDVERASDLKPRSIDLRRRRWKRIED